MIRRPVSKFLFVFLFISTPLLANNSAADISVSRIDKNTFRISIGNSQFDVIIRDKVLLSKKDRLLEWAGYSANAVYHYYGRFPVDRVRIKIEVTDGNRVRFGQAFGGESPSLRVVVGEDITPEVLRKDWIMVHEMVHLAMADVPRNQRWLLEGLATYVESVARAQLGQLSEDFVWKGFLSRMHQGLPASGDRGLDYTPTWGRTYWGGALFCLLADVEIRKQSNNRMSLRDALRGILKEGYSMKAGADNALQIFEAGDHATGLPVLVNLYNEMRAQPQPAELGSLWKSLGLSLQEGEVIYNDRAALATIRKQMLKP
ncbi:MAG: M1 family metallopeptidase [Gammaproteobacteria bacterium]|nr:M1 family metallopeptidase [Gammaproteobacteria bacterium]